MIRRVSLNILLLPAIFASENQTFWQPFDKLYQDGHAAYLEKDWENVLTHMYASIASHNQYLDTLNLCNSQCKINNIGRKIDLSRPYGTELIPAVVLTKSKCLQNCLQVELGERYTQFRYSDEIKIHFQYRRHYDFIQYASYQLGLLKEGAAAAWTYAIYNPDLASAEQNLQFYRTHEGVDESMFKLVAQDENSLNEHLRSHTKAVEFYHKGDYRAAAKIFELALDQYFTANKLCRSECELATFKLGSEYGYGYNEKPNLGSFEEHTVKHWIQTLECNVMCTETIAMMPGQKKAAKNFLPELFNFLQFSYQSLHQIDRAAEAANTYSLFIANNPVMKENMLIYKRKLGGRNKIPEPRRDIIQFLKDMRVEIALLKYANAYLKFDVNERVFDLWPRPKKPLLDFDEDGDYDGDDEKTDADLIEEDHENKENEDNDEKNENAENDENAGNDEKTDEENMADMNKYLADGVLPDDDKEINEMIEEYMAEEKKTFAEETPLYDSSDHKMEEIMNENYLESKHEDDQKIKQLEQNIPHFGYYVVESSKHTATIEKNLPALEKSYSELLVPESPQWIGPKNVEPKLVADHGQLGHKTAHIVDDLISSEDCGVMMNLAKNTIEIGDGYGGNPHPHNQNEAFYGVTLGKVAEKVKTGDVTIKELSTYYHLAERVRRQVMLYNNLTELYQDYVHLVCRDVTSVDSKWQELTSEPQISKHLSHPVHSDNCNLKPDGSCPRVHPAYTWREYSSLVYLNGDYEGGELILASANGRSATHQIKPKCGRMASFCAGSECLHGVKAIKNGRRCALAQWFSVDYSRRDMQHEAVLELLGTHDEL